jgi:hypothetical protein
MTPRDSSSSSGSSSNNNNNNNNKTIHDSNSNDDGRRIMLSPSSTATSPTNSSVNVDIIPSLSSTDGSESHTLSDDGEERTTKNGGWMKQQLLLRIYEIMFKTNHNFSRATAGILLTYVTYILYKKRWKPQTWIWLLLSSDNTNTGEDNSSRQFRHPRQHQNNKMIGTYLYVSLKKVLSLITYVLPKRPDYTSAQEVSLSLLRTAAQHGIVQKALIGPSSIVFCTQDNQWKKTNLPHQHHNPTIQNDMLDLLMNGGCNDISTLPDSLGSKLVTPMITALPFVYLALVYRMLKKIHNGNAMDGDDFFLSKLLPSSLKNKSDNSEQDTTAQTRFSDVAGLDDVIP